MADFIEINHSDININTITEYISDKLGPALFFKDKKNEFLDYEGGSGVSNMDRIFKSYLDKEKIDNPKGYSMELLKMNTVIVLPSSEYNRELASIQGKDQILRQKNFNAFYGKSLLKLLSDPKYKPKNRMNFGREEYLTYINPEISVWIYSGSLDSIINVSPYILSCSINVNANGGSFNITLPPILDLGEQISENFYSSAQIKNKTRNKNNDFYFHKHIQTNDIVFIKFEELDIESNRNSNSLNTFIINKSYLAGQIYDMIGLVDSNSQSIDFQSNDISITVSGRDLMKLLIDDGSYFMPLMYVYGGANDTFINLQKDQKLIKRGFSDGKFNSMFAFSLRSVVDTAQYILNQLSNLGVVGEEVNLFHSYGDRRTKVSRTIDGNELKDELHTGVWQIVKLLVDENVADRRIADSSISQPDGALITQFQKICQEPFVEFFGDTYGDFWNLIIRQPPHTKSQILSVINSTVSDTNEIKNSKEAIIVNNLRAMAGNRIELEETVDLLIDIEGEDVLSESFSWENEQLYSWFEITPQGSFIGSASQVALSFIPIVYLPQYANKWGLKKLSVVSNYISAQSLSGIKSDINRDLLKESIVNDFKFIIDCASYLPFTRKGTITMNGDRRIKRGTWVRYKGTGEIYYVDSVSNSFSINNTSIDRVTTLNVSRGMVEKYTKGSMTYFDIVNTDFIKNVMIEKLTTGGISTISPRINIKSDFGVNKDAFDFFYNREQFSDKLRVKKRSQDLAKLASIKP